VFDAPLRPALRQAQRERTWVGDKGLKVGSFCCPVLPVPLNSLLLPGGFNRVLAL